MRSVSAGILKKIFFGSSGKNLIKLCINQKYEVMTLLHYIRASCNDGKLLWLRVRHVPKKITSYTPWIPLCVASFAEAGLWQI